MHRFYKCYGAYFYHEKSKLITDLCEELQKSKKTYKKQPLYFHEKFELDNHKTCEVWEFEIIIKDKFEIRKAVLTYWDADFKPHQVCFCVDDGCVDWYGNPNNVFENITEFRAFLKREIERQ